MRIKIDECLPYEISEILAGKGHHVETVKDEGLTGSPDEIIWETVQAEKFFLITSDLDFSDIRRYAPGTHQGLLLLRLRQEGKNHILSYFRQLVSNFDVNDWSGCVVVATDHKVRTRKPPEKPDDGAW
jgi:predicted nuclease of predicted toxin-antitoxin system